MSLYETYKKEIVPALKKELGIKNTLAVPKVTKIKVNVGIGSLTKKTKDFSDVVKNVEMITGQKSLVTKSKLAISNFKLRIGMATGITVTIRGVKMYDFLFRLINIVIPRVRDFRGLSPKAFDGNGNYSVGFKEALVFPEVNPDDVMNVHGVQVTIVTTAKTNEEGRALLTQMGFPFKKDIQS